MDTQTTPTTYTVEVPEDKAGARLDKVLAEALPVFSRTRLKALIETDRVMIADSNAVRDPATRVKAGERYIVSVPAAKPAHPKPQPIPLDIVFEDDDLIVVDKPAGLVVHPAPGHADGTLVNALLAHCGDTLSGIGGVTRPGIVHRLDKDTSGLLVVAKNDLAHRALASQLAEHHIERTYIALVWGRPNPGQGEIKGNIGRSPSNRKKMAVVTRGGKTALTRYRTQRAVGAVASLLECRLATGRTHQIRVHLAALGHPVVGDPLYGRGVRRWLSGVDQGARDRVQQFSRQALHAHLIGFSHPRTGKTMRFVSEISIDIKELIDFLDQM